jgi:hypothetical protein
MANPPRRWSHPGTGKAATGSKAVQALDAWLDRQIEGETDEQ